ncbi:MAG TPA: cytochrome c oxidase subunit II [Polyangiaceae bacterium]|nr:cytochrome c oxidase subunit II [Polyangiaceae bacterium]
MNELFRRLLFLPPQASGFARDFDALHYAVITASMLGIFAVGLALAWFSFRYRRSPQNAVRPPRPPLTRAQELTPAFGLLVLFVGFWCVGVRQFALMQRVPAGGLLVYVTAKQWMWSFDYANGDRTNETLYVPTGRTVELAMTSRDVIHSFYVPAFRIKKDVIPGRTTSVWFSALRPGTYPIFCAEYCGLDHSGMRGRVVALTPSEFAERFERTPRAPGGADTPLAEREPGGHGELTSLAARGARVAAARGCLRCHTLDGTPHLAPTWARLYGHEVPLANGSTVVADAAYLTESMMDPLAKVHRGFTPIMPTYRGILTPAETAALVELIRSLADAPLAPPAPLVSAGTPPLPLPAALDGGVAP